MLKTLRSRLLLSYVLILVVTLILIGGALVLVLRSRPLPVDDLRSDLTATLLDVRVMEAIRIEIRPLEGTVEQRIVQYLDSQAIESNTRILVVTGEGEVRFDSDAILAEGSHLNETERTALIPTHRERANVNLFEGRFVDDEGGEWIFVAQPLRPSVIAQESDSFLMGAAPVPHPSLAQVFDTFGDDFLRPLAQAGLFGLVIALGLSVLIARSVVRPLHQMSHAARRIANGDFDQRVPVDGPREVRSLATSFNEMTSRVALTQQAQRDFMASVSHDLRTPLTSIQGFSQAIIDGVASDPASAEHAAQIIHDEAGRLHRMVESLLDLARIEAGRMDMLRRSVQVGDVLQVVGESLSVKAKEKGVALVVDMPPTLPRIAGDGDRLAQVFTNLLDNAIRHTPPDGIVTLQAELQQNEIAIMVRDSGEGIPPDDLPRIFERFYQVDKSRKRRRSSGIGLGLVITHEIVEAHGGTVRVASALGEGTVFTVRLPLLAPDMSTVVVRQ